MTNYIDEIAIEIAESVGDYERPSEVDMPLYRAYALLARAKGTETTLEDVHDAWAACRLETLSAHPYIVPFANLEPDIQSLDQPYVDAIHAWANSREVA